jgi:RNase P subunit RPR2
LSDVLVKCPKCGWTYKNNNYKAFGWYRVYLDNWHLNSREYLILKCRKCGTRFKIMLIPNQEPLLVEIHK